MPNGGWSAAIGCADRYQPQLYVRHTGRQVFKDRLLKLPTQITSAFDDYVRQYDVLFPRTPRLITQVLNEGGSAQVSPNR
jgi:hypothetical protein